MLITRAQGAACRRAAESIITEHGAEMAATDCCVALNAIGWCCGSAYGTRFTEMDTGYDQSQVLMALLWCAEIAGE